MFNPKEKILDELLATSGIEHQIFGLIGDVLTGGASSRNKQARDQASRQNKYNKKVYNFQWKETQRKYDYDKETLEITKRNDEKNLQYQEANLIQKYNYGMGIRDYEYKQAKRSYDQSVATALEQQGYDRIAEKFAYLDQDRFKHEQQIDLAFDRAETLLEYRSAAAGLGLKKRQAQAAAATEAQATRVSALKAQGESAARGVAGRTAAKNIQGIVAETGARQAAIVDEFMFNTNATNIDFVKLNNSFIADQVALDFSEESLNLSDMAARNKIKLNAIQAAINAKSRIELLPEIAPPLPKPFALPRPEYQEVYKPKKPPAPMKAVAAQENLFAAGISTVGGAVAAGLTGQGLGTASGFRGFNWGKAAAGFF